MVVAAKINKLPVLVTDADVNKHNPDEVEIEEDDWDFEFSIASELESCCGVLEMGHIKADYGEKEFEGGLPKQAKPHFVEYLKGLSSDHRSKGLAIYTLTDGQKVEAEACLEAGFEVMAVFRNPNTGNRVTMYGLLMNQPRQTPIAKKAPQTKVRR